MLKVIDILLLLILGIPAVYYIVFALVAALKDAKKCPETGPDKSFCVLVPAYKSDSYIDDTARHALNQNYPSDKFSVVIIADSMKEETCTRLENAGAKVIRVSFENSSKAKSLASALETLGHAYADIAVILDADNLIESDFLSKLNDAFCSGCKAVQAHRCAKNRDTDVAVIDAAAEEINNCIFRKGHNAAGISSALIGSGMAFTYGWLYENISSFKTSGEDKEMELKLLKDGIWVKYLEDALVYDEKTRTKENYYNQRRRWGASQYNIIGEALKGFGQAADKIGYADKLLQWAFPPRMIMLAGIPFWAVIASLVKCLNAAKWWKLTIILLIALIIALPKQHRDKKLLKALFAVPSLAIMSLANMFRMKGTKDNFIHTDHQ